MILNKNNMPLYATGTKYSDSTLKSMTKDKLLEYLDIAQHNYECANESLYNIRQYAEKLNKALDKAVSILSREIDCSDCSVVGCHSNGKSCQESWRDHLMKGE